MIIPPYFSPVCCNSRNCQQLHRRRFASVDDEPMGDEIPQVVLVRACAYAFEIPDDVYIFRFPLMAMIPIGVS